MSYKPPDTKGHAMKKLPTLFVRDPKLMSRVLNEVTPGCEWVLAGEGQATRKFDGTCVLVRRDGMAVKAFARREVKPGKQPPPNFVEADHDDVTGKTVGWEPAEQSGFAKFINEAVNPDMVPGTYELVGPCIQGNPEHFVYHTLIRHGSEGVEVPDPLTFESLRDLLTDDFPFEGIVWHHPDGRMAKLKRRDFE